MAATISFNLNGERVRLKADERRKLLWVLRTELHQTGTKYGCGHGACGACVVLVDGEPRRSCMSEIGSVRDKEIVTIEGLARGDELHPVQKAFIEHDALQCGYCTPGMILSAVGLLKSNPKPSRRDIVVGMDRNLCRCGAHKRIIAAIQDAAEELANGKPRT